MSLFDVEPRAGATFPIEQRVALVERAQEAMLAGVRPTLTEWVSFNWDERAAWITAGKRLRADLASRVGISTQGPLGPALASADLDGGDLAESQFLELLSQAAVDRDFAK